MCPWEDYVVFSSVQSLSCVWLFATPWTTARQDSLSITNSWSPPKPMSIKSVMPSSYLILCHPLLLLLSIFPSIGVFSNEWALRIRWPKNWSFSFNISPSKDYPESSPTSQFKSINSLVLSFLYSSTLTSIHDYWKNHSFVWWARYLLFVSPEAHFILLLTLSALENCPTCWHPICTFSDVSFSHGGNVYSMETQICLDSEVSWAPLLFGLEPKSCG